MKITISSFIICAYSVEAADGYQYLTRLQLLTVPNGILRTVGDYRDAFQAGKDGRTSHRIRVKLPALAEHEVWRWREIKYEPFGFVVTR
jgi:hypothetical protein